MALGEVVLARTRIHTFSSLLLLVGLFGLTNQALAVTVCKDGTCDHTSIKSALLDVNHKGENVIITKPGTFQESDLTIGGTTQGGPRTLMSLNDDPAGTIIDASGSGKAVVSCLGLSTIRGITLRGGNGGVRLCYGGGSRLENVIIEDNIADGPGGGLQASWGPVTIIDSTIRNNKAVGNGGGISLVGSEGLTIRNSRIENNEVTIGVNGIASGGGISIGTFITLLIEDSDIVGNKVFASNQTRGGGISAPTTTILNNVNVSNNIAGPAAFFSGGGGIYKNKPTGSGPLLEVNGGSVSGNVAGAGGGIWLGINSKLSLFGGSVTGNNASDGTIGSGGGVFCAYVDGASLAAGHISGNTPDQIAGCNTPSLGTTRTNADNENSGNSNDPVNTRTGELYQQHDSDISLGGPMPLYFARYYASMFKQVGISATMGNNWRHNFDWGLLIIDNSMDIVNHQGRTIQFNWNGASWDLAGKADIVYQLHENAGTYTLLDPRNQRSYVFNSDGRLISISDGKGNVHSLIYGAQLSQVSDGLGRILNFNYDSNSHLTSVNDGMGRMVILGYTGDDLTRVTDLNGNSTDYVYATELSLNRQGLLFATVRPLGNRPYRHSFWFADKKVAGEKDSNNFNTKFTYTSATETKITDPLGNFRIHTHAASGSLSDTLDTDGQTVTIGSDPEGRRNSVTDRLGGVTTTSYHVASGKLAAKTNADGSTTSYTYEPRTVGNNTAYDLVEITHADGTTETFDHDVSGNPTSRVDRSGNTTSATYNSNAQQLANTNELGGVTTYTYNADGTLADSTDPAGNTTTFDHDGFGRLNRIIKADGGMVDLTHDNTNRLLSTTDENGNSSTLSYDINGNLVSVIDPLGNMSSFAYDENDRLLSTTNRTGGVVSYTFDALGRPETSTDENGNTTHNSYDSLGRLATLTFPLGNSNDFTYDAESVIASVSDGLGNTTSFTSDQMGQITHSSSPLGHVNQTGYDVMGRINSFTDPLSQTTLFNRDSLGLLSGITLPGGNISTAYSRDQLGNIVQTTDPNGNEWRSSYDSQGLRISRTDPLGYVRTTNYDNRNRPAIITYADGVTQTLAYDSAGNLISRSYGGGPDLAYTYDSGNRLILATGIELAYDANNQIINSNGITVTRDPGGRITSMALAAGKEVTYAYDANDNLVSVMDWAGGTTTFSYDAADQMIGITRPNGIDTTFTINNDGRLTGITAGAISSISLTRNANGQVTAATRNLPLTGSADMPSITTYSFDAASQITNAGFTYDARGRLTGDGTRTYTWDAASRLINMTQGTVSTYNYDALGRRTSRTAGGVTRNFVWNDALFLSSISIEAQGGTDQRYFIHTPSGALLYSIAAAGNTRSFYHYDEKGNTVAISNDAGAVIGSYAYSPYGKLTASTGSLDNPFTWQGKNGVVDDGNGLYYMRARYYDSETGRFISRDLIRSINPKEVNPYQYASGNPMKYSDPMGLDDFDDAFDNAENELIKLGVDTIAGLLPWTPFNASERSLKTDEALAIDATKQYLGKFAKKSFGAASKKAGLPGKIIAVGEFIGKLGIIAYNLDTDIDMALGKAEVRRFGRKREWAAQREVRRALVKKDINSLSSMSPLARELLRQKTLKALLDTKALLKVHRELFESSKLDKDYYAEKIKKDKKKLEFLEKAVNGELVPGEAGYGGLDSIEPASYREAANDPSPGK